MQPFVDELKAHFKASQAKNPHYSLRAFSQKLGLGSGAVSEIFSGKRSLTLKNFIFDKFLSSLSQLQESSTDGADRSVLLSFTIK